MKKESRSDTSGQESPRVTVPQIRTIFMGTSPFAASILAGLADHRYNIVAVYTQPDKPIGRKQETKPSAVKVLAQEKLSQTPIEQPARWDAETVQHFKEYQPDLVVVAAYGKILPATVLDIPGFNCINVHASLLPRWRGASPIQNALLAGDTETGITLIRMEASVDTGPIIAVRTLPIEKNETTGTLSVKLAELGTGLLLETIPRWVENGIEAIPQDEKHITLCQLIEREDGRIFWNEDAETLERKMRALSPWPGLFTFWKQPDGTVLRIKFLDIAIKRTSPEIPHKLGEVFEIGETIGIQCGSGIVFPVIIQLEGKTPAAIGDFVSGYPGFVGSILS